MIPYQCTNPKCQNTFTDKHGGQKYCSRKCRIRHHSDLKSTYPKEEKCLVCHKIFQQRRSNNLCCSKKCYDVTWERGAKARDRRKNRLNRFPIKDICANKKCKKKYTKKRRSQTTCCKKCRDHIQWQDREPNYRKACILCGAKIIARSGNKKYCTPCAIERHKESHREAQKRRWRTRDNPRAGARHRPWTTGEIEYLKQHEKQSCKTTAEALNRTRKSVAGKKERLVLEEEGALRRAARRKDIISIEVACKLAGLPDRGRIKTRGSHRYTRHELYPEIRAMYGNKELTRLKIRGLVQKHYLKLNPHKVQWDILGMRCPCYYIWYCNYCKEAKQRIPIRKHKRLKGPVCPTCGHILTYKYIIKELKCSQCREAFTASHPRQKRCLECMEQDAAWRKTKSSRLMRKEPEGSTYADALLDYLKYQYNIWPDGLYFKLIKENRMILPIIKGPDIIFSIEEYTHSKFNLGRKAGRSTTYG